MSEKSSDPWKEPEVIYTENIGRVEMKVLPTLIEKHKYDKLLWYCAKHISNTDPAFSLSSPAEVVEYLEREIDK